MATVDGQGAGGAGEVYRAEDSTLGRDVAIKVLLESFYVLETVSEGCRQLFETFPDPTTIPPSSGGR